MSNLISRQDAIDAVTRAIWHYPNESYKNLNVYEVAEALVSDAIKSIPSAEPKTGHAETASSGVTVWAVCSECKKPIDLWDNYCRSCGARMNGGEEE